MLSALPWYREIFSPRCETTRQRVLRLIVDRPPSSNISQAAIFEIISKYIFFFNLIYSFSLRIALFDQHVF